MPIILNPFALNSIQLIHIRDWEEIAKQTILSHDF